MKKSRLLLDFSISGLIFRFKIAGKKFWDFLQLLEIHKILQDILFFWNFVEKNWEIARHLQKIVRHCTALWVYS